MPAYWEQKPWRSLILQNDNGSAKPLYSNAVAALRNDEAWKGVMAYDSFHKSIAIRRENEFGLPIGNWNERCTHAAVEWVQQIGISASFENIEKASRAVALEQEFNPLQDYLNGLEWDGVPRIGRWLVEYCQADEDEFTNVAGRLWMIGAVSRALNPGGKFDNALLLEGEQGIKKSTAFATLGGDYFTDDMPDLHHKDSKEAMRGAWIVEFGELSAMRKSDVEATKAFITRRTDRYRRSYGKDMEDFPRTSVFGGTTNSDEYLEDVKNRRFWPVRVFKIDIERLRQDRDQMWAEAVAAYKAGEKWWMDSDMDSHAQAAQESRRVVDPWEPLVRRYIAEEPMYDGLDKECRWSARAEPLTWVTLDDVLEKCLLLTAKDRSHQAKGRVQKILTVMGWERKQTPVKWCYRAPNYV